ncbi:MAG: penicillin-binding protein 2 [Rubrobacter sp.]|nr:penicillin-binding protein 2 [Rubrobacter sp.]
MLRVPVKKPERGEPERSALKKRETTPAITKGNMQIRVVTFAILVAVLFSLLAGRLWQLQVLTGEVYTETAQQTHTKAIKIPAQRGVVYDRHGEVLANNVPGLNVTVVPDEISRDKVAELADILEADKEAVLGRYDAAKDADTYNPYSPILVRENAGREAVTYISERTGEFPGLAVNDDWVRSYPQGRVAAHVLGYTGAITLQELKLDGYEDLANDAIVGKSGVELSYEDVLRGRAGSKEYSVDALGRVVTLRRADGTRADGEREVSPMLEAPARITDPKPGKNLTLTLDLDLQKTAERELKLALERARDEGYEASGGAVVAMDPRNGEILAMSSQPEFDPQLFVGGISGADEIKTFDYQNSKAANYPFSNRAITAGQPAASTFKVFTGMAGLAAGVITPYTTVTDNGDCWRPAGSSWGCWQSWRENSPNREFLGTHGTQNFTEAIKDSNDKFFYQVADWIWNQTSDENWLPRFYREKFGFGRLTGTDLPGETAGRVPTRAGERELMMALQGSVEPGHWTVGDWVNLSIGQGDLLVSPVQLVRAYAAIQNGGTLVTPHVGKEISYQGEVEKKISPGTKEVGIDPSFYQTTIEGMRGVTERKGTAYGVFRDSELDVAGKSGTGETGGDFVNWFVGWAEYQEDPLVVVALVENGGVFETGSEMTSGPVVRHILESYYGVDQSPEDQYATDLEPRKPDAKDDAKPSAKDNARSGRDRTGKPAR